jgi:DNA-binding XRE family transcriptional regulator
MPRQQQRDEPHPVWRWRRLYGVKQATLAREAGLHVVTLSRIENGAEPSVSNALAICRALSMRATRPISVEDVFGDGPYPEAFERAVDDLHRAVARATEATS